MSMSLTRGGYAPLENAGEYVCDCLRDGDRVSPRWGKSVHEQVVRCRDCAMYEEVSTCGKDFSVCKRFDESYHITEPDGFCAWGIEKED